MPLAVERRIVERASAGGEALESLINAIWPEAYRLAFTILRDRGLAEDAAQEACVAIARGLPSLKNCDAFAAWSYKIIANSALATVRARDRVQTVAASDIVASRQDRSDAIDLYAAMAHLEPLQRAVVLMHYYAGFTSAEIATATGQPASTVRFHLMLARRTLRKALVPVEETHSNREVVTDVH